MAQKEFFQIIYDGDALQSHEMDVRDLAPALMAVSDMLDEANTIVYGDLTRIQVNVKGSFKTGSFGVEFSVLRAPLDGLIHLFNSEETSAAANLLQLVGFVGIPGSGGLIGLLLWLKNRKIKKITKDNGKAIVEVDEEKREVEEKVIELFANVKIRTSVQKVITEPLSKEGVDTFGIKKDNHITTIRKEDKDYFAAPAVQDELLKDSVREVYLTALSISFVEDNKWRFSDGNVAFYAAVKDEKFINDVQENKDSFSKDDIFRVKLREKQWISDTGIKTEYEIEEVTSHRSAAKQIKLPFENDEEKDKHHS